MGKNKNEFVVKIPCGPGSWYLFLYDTKKEAEVALKKYLKQKPCIEERKRRNFWNR